MKKFILPALCAMVMLTTTTDVVAQKRARTETLRRCGTTERVATIFRFHPELRNLPNRRLPSTNNNYRLESIATIPVVVHIVLSNPWLVTDADVQGQIDRLNLDFSGLNPDSTNGGPTFTGLRGHSQIQFCLAKRTPGGQLTNGIERRASATGSNVNLAADPIKHTANGGLDVWDPNSYLNLWVGVDDSGDGVLGYAQFPGTLPPAEDGVFLNFESFGSSACYTISVYNKGRTGTHEVGHYLGLFHIWGDESGCSGDDFENLSSVGSVNLPANLANAPGDGNTPADIGDTPNQAGATTNCPSSTTTDACALVAPGKMFQDYMDYTEDACYSMFTKKQVQRMEWVVNNARTGLMTSLGCQPPGSAVSLDALPFESVNPGGMEVNGCTATSYPSTLGCSSSIQPKLRIKNNGTTNMTSVTAGYRYDNGAAVSNSYVVNIPAGGTTVITLPSQSLSGGNHSFKFFTFNPNGAADQTPANDTLVSNFTVSGAVALPITEQFTGATFPPTGWLVTNPNAGSITWSRWTGTSPTGTPYSSPASAWMDIYSYSGSLDHQDYLWTPPFAVSDPADSVILTFQVAHRGYSGADDTLEVVYSTNCGTSWQRLGGYYKWSTGSAANALATVTPPCPSCIFAPASAAQWRQERVGFLPSALGSPASLMIGWKTINDYGNNIFVDDVNIVAKSVYTFIGTGNWSVASNWLNNKMPPAILPAGNEIIINPSSGNSVKDMSVTLSPGSKLTVMPGKTLIVP